MTTNRRSWSCTGVSAWQRPVGSTIHPMLPRRALIGSLVLAVVAGCTSSGGGGGLPAGPELLDKAAESMKSVTSTHFSIKVDGELPNVPVKSAEGDLNAQGESQG